MATPLVAGTVALIQGAFPGIDAQSITSKLLGQATWDVLSGDLGSGSPNVMLDVAAALPPLTLSPTPTSTLATAQTTTKATPAPSPAPTTSEPTTTEPTTAPTPAPSTSKPTPAPSPAPSTSEPTPAPSPAPSTSEPTPAPSSAPATSEPTPAPTTPLTSTIHAYCPAGYGDYGTRYNWGLGKITLVTTHTQCSDRCSQFSGPQFNGGCKAYMTGMYFGMLFCRSYGGNLRTQPCPSWAVPTDPGFFSGALGSSHTDTNQENIGGNCCSNSTFVDA